MSRKRYTAEQIIGMLREAEVLLSQGQKVGEVSRRLGITEQTYYRWRREYGGLKSSQAKVIHRLENPGEELLEIIEVQSGSYLGEDDIERIADEYGRE